MLNNLQGMPDGIVWISCIGIFIYVNVKILFAIIHGIKNYIDKIKGRRYYK